MHPSARSRILTAFTLTCLITILLAQVVFQAEASALPQATHAAGQSHTGSTAPIAAGIDLDYAVYFNERATTATSTTLDPTPMENALLGFIDGASSTLDVALYGLNRQSIVDSLISAHNRGVTVRVVGDDDAVAGTYAASYQALTGAGITVTNDTRSSIQHNKFMVFDSQIVWTGSTNFTDTGLTLNANNSIVVTSTLLADTYTAEFNEMASGTFHSDKGDNTSHLFDYNGTQVESYFSPTDGVALEVREELAQADSTLHFAMFFWTDDLLTDRVVERLDAGVHVYGVWDQLGAANAYSDDETLSAAGAQIRVEDFAGKVHHKFAVIDAYGSDPVVILGSYNWTNSGANENDENTLIIHSAPLAQAYYAEWQRLWGALDSTETPGSHTTYLPLVVRQTPEPTPEPTPVPTQDPTPTPPPAPADVDITYICYDPEGSDVEAEYVRIANTGGSAQSMTGWTLRDLANHTYTFPNFTLGAGASVKVWVKSGSDTATDLYWNSSSAIWNNTGDTAYLRDAAGQPVSEYSYY